MCKVREKKYFLLLFAELLFLFLLLPGCFRKYEGLEYSAGDAIILTPGVYEIRVWPKFREGQTGQSVTVEMQSENAPYRSLRTNAVTIFQDHMPSEPVVISVWVTAKISDARIQCDFSDEGVGLDRLEVLRTARGDRIRLFTVTVGMLLADAVVILRHRILCGKLSPKRQSVIWILMAGILIVYFPYLTDYFILAEDTSFYLKKILNMEGVSYGEIFLLIPAGLKRLGFPIMTAYKIWVLAAITATALIVYFMLYLCVKEEYAALAGSMFYLLMPDYFNVIYQRGDMGEVLLKAFLPLLGAGIYLLVTDRGSDKVKKYICCAVIGLFTVGSSMMLLAKNAEGVGISGLGSGVMLLFLGYGIWRGRTKATVTAGCRFWMWCSVMFIVAAWFHVPGRWMIPAEMSAALFTAFLYPEFTKQKKALGQVVFAVAAVVAICAAVYHVNRIAYTSEAVYLYEVQNMANLYQTEEYGEEGGAR